MQISHSFEEVDAMVVGWGVRVLLLTDHSENGVSKRLSGFASCVDVEVEVYSALSAMIDDPSGYGLFVMDCDAFGGLEAGKRATATLQAVQSRVPVILISKEFPAQVFPQSRDQAVCLRAPLSALSLRVGFEHALRDRLMWKAA